jgi:hypothetical protein
MFKPENKKKYYIKMNGKTYGPTTLEKLKKMASEGKLQPWDKVSDSWPPKEWFEPSSIPDLNEIFNKATEVQLDGVANRVVNNSLGNERLLVSCKTCGARISKNAAKCPQCGEDTESSSTKIIMLGFVGLITLAVMISIGNKVLKEQDYREREQIQRDYNNAKEKETKDFIKKLNSEMNNP